MTTRVRWLAFPSLVLVIIALHFVSGCGGNARLEPGGAYAGNGTNSTPDIAFFTVDSAYDLARSAIDLAFKTEYQNRALFWQLSPNIKKTLDGIRPQALDAEVEYLKARATYVSNPTPPGLTTLQQVLAKLQALAVAAQSAIPKQ